MFRGHARWLAAVLALVLAVTGLSAAPVRAADDLLGPVVESMSFTPEMLDPSEGTPLRITARVTDATEVQRVRAYVFPQGDEAMGHGVDLARVSGSVTDGTYRADFVFPPSVLPEGLEYGQKYGYWGVQVWAVDVLGHRGTELRSPTPLMVLDPADSSPPMVTGAS